MMERFKDKMQDIENGILLTLEDAADMLGVPVNKVRGWANTGELPSLPISPRGDLQFRMGDVIAFLMEQIKGEPDMQQPKYEMDDEGKRCFLKLEELASILDVHVDEARTLVEVELLPYVYKYIQLCSNPRPESRFRREDVRFLSLK
jgi:hypothetical protein